MKITIYSLASDTRDGTNVSIFADKAALLDDMRHHIREGVTDNLTRPVEELTDYEIEELFHDPEAWAWDMDTYCVDERDITIPALTGANLDAILAGLRLLQRELDNGDLPPGIRDIYTNCGEHQGLDTDLVGDLCEEINQ